MDLTDPAAVEGWMRRPPGAPDPDPPPEGARWVPVRDREAIARLLDRASAGEAIDLLPPGLSADGKNVLVRDG